MVPVVLTAFCPQTLFGSGKLRRNDVVLQPRPRPRGDGLSLKKMHSPAPFLNVNLTHSEFSQSNRPGALGTLAAASTVRCNHMTRCVAVNLLTSSQTSPRCLIGSQLLVSGFNLLF